MLKIFASSAIALTLAAACSSDPSTTNGPSGGAGGGGAGAVAGTGGAPAGSGGVGTGGSAQAGGGAGGATAGNGTGGSFGGTAGAGGSATGGAGGTGVTGGSGGTGGNAGSPGAGGSVNAVPADYKGTPYSALKIPGRINACDYDRGGPGVGWCHNAPGDCGGGTVTGDYPGGVGPYRTPMPANAKICSGAQCDDNAGVCRMNKSKPDNTINGQAMPAEDSYLCYTTAGMWSKYTVHVDEAGTYSVGGIMAVPQNGAFNLSFGNNITTGDVKLAITPTTNSGSGENYHSWDTRTGLATVTFPAAGTYLMTFTQVGRFNADAFTFTKM